MKNTDHSNILKQDVKSDGKLGVRVNLSYVITTYNKLPYLKNVLSLLIQNIEEDEEIVITDGGSTDGTKEYLEQLFNAGKIHQYLSEKDYGEAHGWNKAWLMAKGTLLKIITDDDAFYYPGIQKCKEFMLNHPEIDVIGTDGLFSKVVHESTFVYSKTYSGEHPSKKSDCREDYARWRDKGIPFAFCNLGWMLRKSSIPILGLCDPTFTGVDVEFAIRMTYGKANLAWFTGKTWLRILNPGSNSVLFDKKIRLDYEKLHLIYPHATIGDGSSYKRWHRFLPKRIKTPLKSLRDKLFNKKHNTTNTYIPTEKDWGIIFKLRVAEIEDIYNKETATFIYKGQK